ncbi:MAG: potassium transporter, partial [Bacteroidota bacterium]
MNQQKIEVINCDLCVVGMGVAGLNALSSASQYLKANSKVVVVDRMTSNTAVGGMWNNVYGFVRLHQPHPLFTVGSKKWKLKENPGYLADKNQIVKHFRDCYESLKEKVSIIEKFGYCY